ncbi:MAG TPA: TRAP transporter small permease subunit, partial [Xanthomonadales bacterium]|nr:TRAP transporter small permease subunit [Xanthomonadales bacterium]
LAGAVAAARSDKQINIAVLDRFLPAVPAAVINIIVHLFTTGICGLVTFVSGQFVYSSWEYGDTLLGNVPAWILQAILPLGFALMTWRYGVFVFRGLVNLFRTQAKA